MLRWSVHLEGGPRRVNHAAVAVGHKVYSFGGYCSGEDYETLRQIDVHVFNTGRWCLMRQITRKNLNKWRETEKHDKQLLRNFDAMGCALKGCVTANQYKSSPLFYDETLLCC